MVKSHALRLVPSLNESRWFHALNSVSCTRSSARSLSPHSDTANARKLPISATRESRKLADTLRGNLFISASLEVFQESQQMFRYGIARDLIENRPNMAADVSLQAGGQAVGLSPGRIPRHVGAAAPCLVHFIVSARHLAPAILLVRVAVHNPSPITHQGDPKIADSLDPRGPKTPHSSNGSITTGT